MTGPRPFRLTAAESAALERARREYEAWFAGLRPLRLDRLARLRKAAKAMHSALQPFTDGHPNPEAARLLGRMQEIELQHPSGHYADLLTTASYAADLIARALAGDVRPGRRPNERAYTWVRIAAAAWGAAGLRVAPAGRFGHALDEFKHRTIPIVKDRDQIRLALQG